MATQDATKAFVEPLITPVEMKIAQEISGRGLSKINYLVASNGTILTFGLPESWTRFLLKKINAGNEEYKRLKAKPLYSMVIPDVDLVEDWKGQVFEINPEDGLPYRKSNYRFNRIVNRVKARPNLFKKYKRHKTEFPLKQPVHVVATIYISDRNEGTLPEFLSVIHRLLTITGYVGWKQKDSWIKSFDGSRVFVVPKEQARVEIVIKEYIE